MPASLAAMNPCVMMTPSSACQAAMQRRSGAKSHVADRKLAFTGAGALLGAQHGARVDPASGDALRIEKGAADRRGEELAHRHDPRPAPLVDLAAYRAISAIRLRSSAKNVSNMAPGSMRRVSRQIAVRALDALEPRPVSADYSRGEKRFEAIGDA